MQIRPYFRFLLKNHFSRPGSQLDRDGGTELYDHAGDDGMDFDAFEIKNENATYPQVVSELRELMRSVVKNQSRLPTLLF